MTVSAKSQRGLDHAAILYARVIPELSNDNTPPHGSPVGRILCRGVHTMRGPTLGIKCVNFFTFDFRQCA